jgi:hypothetical protein
MAYSEAPPRADEWRQDSAAWRRVNWTNVVVAIPTDGESNRQGLPLTETDFVP